MLTDLSSSRKIKEGDIRSFERLFRSTFTPLCLYATGITGRREIAEEIVQDVFYILWRDRERLQIFQSIKAYLYAAVRNRSLQYCEHSSVEEQHREQVLSRENEPENSTPLEVVEYRELEDLINRALTKLPPRRLRIFRLHREEGRRYNEIAKQLSISVKTVEAEMSKALQALRKEVEKYKYVI